MPAADTGISVASTASVRQRVQSLGRVFVGPRRGGIAKRAEMHLLYVDETVDDLIYGKTDWSDLTGRGIQPVLEVGGRHRLRDPLRRTAATTQAHRGRRVGTVSRDLTFRRRGRVK